MENFIRRGGQSSDTIEEKELLAVFSKDSAAADPKFSDELKSQILSKYNQSNLSRSNFMKRNLKIK